MRNLLFASVIVLSSAEGFAQTNVYHPFPEDSAVWTTDLLSQGCLGYCYSKVYTMKGDTVMNSISYNKIYVRDVKFFYNGPPPFPAGYTSLSAEVFWAGLRQDSLAKKVYIIRSGWSSDTLLYDFNLSIGDTIPQTALINGMYAQWQTVIAIDSVLINGKYHKRYKFNNIYDETSMLIEGVGSTGQLDIIYNFFEGGPITVCFTGNIIGSPAYPGECAVDAFVLSSHLNKQDKMDMLVNPNPTSGKFQITGLSSWNSTIIITDLVGNVVSDYGSNSDQQIDIDISQQPKGVYFVKAVDEKGSFAVRKIILQ